MSKTIGAGAVLGNLVEALNMLETCREFSWLMPEVRVNLVYALPQAQTSQDVAAVDGRITVVRGFPHASGMPTWGASDHLARRILEIQKYDAEINAAINFKCNQQIIEVVQQYCSERCLLFGWLDRSQEPDSVTEYDGASMPWKVRQLFDKYKAIPRVFYEGPGWGKEPLFLALGRDAVEVVTISIEIARRM
jgi:hydroxymethylpyrimidine/phosphomethylpyrimidine kinase